MLPIGNIITINLIKNGLTFEDRIIMSNSVNIALNLIEDDDGFHHELFKILLIKHYKE